MKGPIRSSAPREPRRACFTALLGLLGAVFPPVAMAGSFQAVGAMAAPRTDMVVVTLADGSALVIGGSKLDGELVPSVAIVERFDLQTNRFAPVGSMVEPREGHAALLLRDGRVLVVGGTTGHGPPGSPFHPLQDAEIYDPETATFSLTGKSASIRGGLTLALLPDGRALVAGGWTNNLKSPSVEIFDPATGQFKPGGPLKVPRYLHADVTLPDGRVVFLGGYGLDNNFLKQVEIYDPKSDTCSPAGSLVEGRARHKAALLPDGRILIVGGVGRDLDHPVLLDRVEIYDPATQKATVAARMPKGVRNHNLMALRDGRVLINGGLNFWDWDGSAEVHVPSQLFLPATAEIVPAGSMVDERSNAGATLLGDGRVLIVGGVGIDRTTGEWVEFSSAEVYVP